MAINFAAINTVYNHYLTSYAPNGSTPFDSHKRSELRGVYNSIVKMNKDSPLYLLDTSKATQEYVVGLKENARELRNTIASLGGLEEDQILNKKTAFSSNENIAVGKYIGDPSESTESEDMNTEDIPTLDIEVLKLASPQSNMGNFLPDSEMGLSPAAYSFDIGINDLNYEFQFNIGSNTTNKESMTKLSNLITNANIGLTAKVLEDGQGNSSLELRSTATGRPFGKDQTFTVSDDKTSQTSGAVQYFGIGGITNYPSHSRFLLNGNEHESASNTFTVEKMYEITLNGVSPMEGGKATIGLKTDTESMTENIRQLFQGYNQFMQAASSYRETHPKATQLVREMGHISSLYQKDLDSFGLQIQEDGSIAIDSKILAESAEGEDAAKMLSDIKDFTQSVLRKTGQISLNPMDYVDKTIVAYKNPGHNYATPYITSAYSGMMFNSYC